MTGRFLLAFFVFLATGLCIFGLPQATAMVDVGLSFEPDTVMAGNSVIASASITNLCDHQEQVSLALTVTFWGWTFGPVSANFWLEPYESVSGWREIKVPRCFPPGTLTFTVVATTHDGVDSDVATLTVLPSAVPCDWWMAETEARSWLDATGTSILDIFQGIPTQVSDVNWGKIKQLFAP